MSFKNILRLLIYITAIFLLGWLFINLMVMDANYRNIDNQFSMRLPLNSLYDQSIAGYYEKIYQARAKFKIEPKVNPPCFVIIFGDTSLNAFYSHESKCVLITERGIIEFTSDELLGVLAHEFAHAEYVEKHGFENRPHWMVDVRGVEISGSSGKAGLISFIQKQANIYSQAESDLRRHPYLFFVALRYGYEGALRACGERLAHLYAIPD